MPGSTVAIVSLGGTITMTEAQDSVGLKPSLSAEELVKSVPALSQVSNIVTRTLSTLPGASLDPITLLDVLSWSTDAINAGATGVVMIQGTDTIEETSYLLDLFWNHDEPLVVTGAMRAPQQLGADGPANLHAAVLTALDPRSRGRGVLVVLNDTVHAASRVKKTDAIALNAFQSEPFGPLARLYEGRIAFENTVHTRSPLPIPAPKGAQPNVFIWHTFLGDDGSILSSLDESSYDGLVIAAFGAGHVSSGLAETVSEIVKQKPVIFTSRAEKSMVLNSTYAFVGSERDLISRGAYPGGSLSAIKARLLLWALLSLDTPRHALLSNIMMRGDLP